MPKSAPPTTTSSSIAPTMLSTSSPTPIFRRSILMSSKTACTPSPPTTPVDAARKPHSGVSPNPSPVSSLPSSASPPTKSGHYCQKSQAANPASTSPSSPTSPTSFRVTQNNLTTTGNISSPSAT